MLLSAFVNKFSKSFYLFNLKMVKYRVPCCCWANSLNAKGMLNLKRRFQWIFFKIKIICVKPTKSVSFSVCRIMNFEMENDCRLNALFANLDLRLFDFGNFQLRASFVYCCQVDFRTFSFEESVVRFKQNILVDFFKSDNTFLQKSRWNPGEV